MFYSVLGSGRRVFRVCDICGLAEGLCFVLGFKIQGKGLMTIHVSRVLGHRVGVGITQVSRSVTARDKCGYSIRPGYRTATASGMGPGYEVPVACQLGEDRSDSPYCRFALIP